MHALATIFAPVAGVVARRALVGRSRSRVEPEGGRFTRGDVRRLMTATFRIFGELSPRLHREATPGGRMNLTLACLTLSFHRGRFPFDPPAYVMRDAEARDAIVFDVLRWPIAEYFRDQEATDVYTGTSCDLDHALAEAWGGRLVRKETLAGGAPRCDLRWEPTAPAAVRTE